jgi:hypothetical protein
MVYVSDLLHLPYKISGVNLYDQIKFGEIETLMKRMQRIDAVFGICFNP